MGKGRRIFRRRDFIRTGILGGAALSLPLGRFFSSIRASSSPGMDDQRKPKGADQSRVYDVAKKYGAEFGAIRPASRRYRNGRL
jgi:hypothetical protein